MIIDASINSNKTDFLVQKFFELRSNGASVDEILVLVQNSRKKKRFVEKIKQRSKKGNIGNLNVYSFFGLARSTIEKNWAQAENIIKDANALAMPNLCGLEVSQHIFKNCIKQVEFKGYNSKVNLLHQLLRRYSLIVQNALDENEVRDREKILKEAYAKDVAKAINLYKISTLNLRAFDYLRQVGIFEYLYKNIKNPYKYVILDDADEITPACFEYLKFIKPDIKEFFIATDFFGSSRLGYLSAALIDFEKFLDEKALNMHDNSEHQKNAQKLFSSVKENKPAELQNVDVRSFIRRDEMLGDIIKKINLLIKNGTNPDEIAIVSPLADNFLRHELRKLKCSVFFLSGSEKLNQNPVVGAIVELLKIINSKESYFLSPFILKNILLEIFHLPPSDATELALLYREENIVFKVGIIEFFKTQQQQCIVDFLELYENIKEQNLSAQLYKIASKYIKCEMKNQTAILKLNKLAKQISDFEEVFGKNFKKKELIEQLENTIISENPLSEEEIPKDCIIVSTAQKLIDSELKVKHLFLADASDAAWIKQDIGMLYNSWVFQKNWSKKSFDLDDNLELTLDRSARILYKLYLCQMGQIYLYSSIYDTLGTEHFGAIDKFFLSCAKEKKASPNKIVPRSDQKEVLNYKSGKMAVSAVAGSGKTTIMLALIIKILEGEIIKNIKPENIFVLTFMESAARNFRERIKQNFPDMVEMPQISTIHGLALRILKENNNYTFCALDNDFEIIDEIKKREILSKILSDEGIEYSKTELYDKALSDFKNEVDLSIDKVKSPSFKIVYKKYQNELRENNYVDYDDLLKYALKLLKTNSSVCAYYQGLARVIIEDEAQDSSPTQQELIQILGAKSGNIIRCGDVNQAITATFSNSDIKGFKEFIKNNKNVEMNYSQRCGFDIINYANKIIDYAKTNAPQAFLDIKMHGVKGKNSTSAKVELETFEKGMDEKIAIAKKIKNIRHNSPNASIAILTRSNRAITLWADFMENNSIKTRKNFDLLSNNPVFRTVLAIFNFINNPYDKKEVKKSLEALLRLEVYCDEKEILNYADKNNFLDKEGSKFRLWWDLKYFLYKSSPTPMELALEISEYYFSDGVQKANAAMVYSLIEKICATHKTFENMLFRMNEISDRINKSAKFFEDEKKNENDTSVRIMTLHKSKGDEFDYVFIPELTSDNLGLTIEDIKLKENTKFIQKVKKNPKNDDVLKQEILDENYRLLYVGITRAKERLYLTCAKSYKFYKNEKAQKPCEIFNIEDLRV